MFIAFLRPTCLNIQMVLGGNLAHSSCNPFFLLFRNQQHFRHVQLLIPHHKAEQAAVNVWCYVFGHIVEGLEMPFYRVFVGQQHRVIPPDDFLLSDHCRQFFQRLNAFVYAGHVGLYVLPIGGDGVVEMAVKAVGDLMQPRQNWTIVLAAELHHVDGLRRELDSVHHIMVKRITA